MKQRHAGLLGLGFIGALCLALIVPVFHLTPSGLLTRYADRLSAAIAQSPTAPPVQALPPVAPTPAPPPAAPFPKVPIPPLATPPPPAPPASTAPPLPLSGDYRDPAGRFKVGILNGFKVSPLAGSVLIEAIDGNLAYAVVPQSQPLGNPLGVSAGYDTSDSLAKIATTVFQRGEGFQPGPPRMEAGGGAVMDWTGTLTIAGTSQPVGGVILVRSTTQNLLLLMITATQAGAKEVPNALAALANSLQPL